MRALYLYVKRIYGGFVCKKNSTRYNSAVPGFESGVFPAHSCLPISGGLPPGMAHSCGLTSVRGNRGENYEKEPLVHQKHRKKKK
jgi:hypothetical protein